MTSELRPAAGPTMDHAAALLEQNRLLGELIRTAAPDTEIPTCPGWTLVQLFRHVGRGHRWAAQMVADRATQALDPRTVRDGKPPNDLDGAIAWLHASAQDVLDAVAEAGADSPVWTFLGPRPSTWWIRRRLHEETVHGADAAIALGLDFHLDAQLAADGVSEWLDLIAGAGRSTTPAALDDGVVLHLHATDPGLGAAGEWTAHGTGGGVEWESGHRKGAVALRGTATELLLALSRRRSVEQSGIEVLGERAVWDGWLARTPF